MKIMNIENRNDIGSIQIQNLLETHRLLNQEIETYKKINADLASKCELADFECKKLKEKCEKYEKDWQTTNKYIEDIKKDFDTLIDKNAHLTDSIDNYEKIINDLNSNLKSSMNECSAYKSKNDRLEMNIKLLKLQNENLLLKTRIYETKVSSIECRQFENGIDLHKSCEARYKELNELYQLELKQHELTRELLRNTNEAQATLSSVDMNTAPSASTLTPSIDPYILSMANDLIRQQEQPSSYNSTLKMDTSHSLMQQHQQQHVNLLRTSVDDANKPVFKCMFCHYSTTLKYNFNRHVQLHKKNNYGNNSAKCKYCNFTSAVQQVTRHEKTHKT